jgi:hypothetical protein
MRMRFRKDEKAAFTRGTSVQVRTGRYWHPATVIGDVERPYGTIEHIECRVTSGKYRGQIWHGQPTSIRLPQ